MNVYRSGLHIDNSPFCINVGNKEIGNASRVKVYGPGVKPTGLISNEQTEFTVDTRDAGYGSLSLSIEGPSKADIECHDSHDGTCTVNYTPTEPGNYLINIKYADCPVPGSLFSVEVGGEGNYVRLTEQIMRHRDAVNTTAVGSECELSLRITGTLFHNLCILVHNI